MKAQIKSTIAIVQTRNKGIGFVTREIYKWNLNFDTKTAIPLIRECVFVEVEKTRLVLVNDVEEQETYTGRDVTVLREYDAEPFKEVDINNLFKAMQNPIEVNEDFMSELKVLLQQALLIDTRSFNEPFYGLEDNQLEIDNYTE